MTLFDLCVRAFPVAVALGMVLLVARLAGLLACRLRQPSVVAEIAAGMLIGFLVGRHGTPAHHVLMPLRLIGQTGLALFLVGAAHGIKTGIGRGRTMASGAVVGRVAAGAFLLPLAAGALLAGWVSLTAGPRLRGPSPAVPFVLVVAVSLAITAVPVLARILADRNLAATPDGRIAITAAVIIDAASWPLLALAIAIDAGATSGAIRPVAVLVTGVAAAAVARTLLRTRSAGRLCVQTPRAIPAAIGLAALAASAATERYGMTAIFGAVLVGLAVPPDSPAAPWSDAVRLVARAGRFLVPVYFVVLGMTLLGGPTASSPWLVLVPATGLAILAKVTGGYVGARLGGRSHVSGLRVGVLMNTRGLTEIVVLQAGYSAGILTAGLYLALVIMALTTTALTAPLLSIIDRRSKESVSESHPARAVGAQS